jgi:alanine racemase
MSGQKTSARFSDMLVYTQGFVSTAFVFAVGINNAGLGLSTDQQCFNAIRVCIAMYGAAKTAL